MASFAAQVGSWANKVDGALEAVFKESAQELVNELNKLAPVDTGFLRSSLMASTTRCRR
ncbi:HK97 gp10 family phage protein [Mesorhizobium amorphae]|uniref:HK97 gp10 family phage protein n=1 Tax=Mesorhizobium amorphae TaxID=71433 RepID=UPI0021B3837D|nr:HK97 gp10 family phage protein [Mesorhizobium amorphae]